MIDQPILLAITLMLIVSAVHAAARLAALRPILNILPTPFWCYFLPMLGTAAGWLPTASPLYTGISTYLLPACLTLLLLGTDLRAIARLGPHALTAMLTGSLGILLGAQVSLTLLHPWLPDDAWMGFGALSGSWIGGSANMLAIREALAIPDTIFAPLIVVDASLTYTWMGVLIAGARMQHRWDRWVGANEWTDTTSSSEMASLHQPASHTQRLHPASAIAGALLLAVGIAWISGSVGRLLPSQSGLLSPSTWTILLVTTISLILSLTPVARLATEDVTRIGYWLLFLIVASVGARASLTAIIKTPIWLAVGCLWIATHATILLTVGKLCRLPLFLLATASQANIGGPASAPIVAAVYRPQLASVGLLMALLGNLLGTYLGLLSAHLCRFTNAWLR